MPELTLASDEVSEYEAYNMVLRHKLSSFLEFWQSSLFRRTEPRCEKEEEPEFMN